MSKLEPIRIECQGASAVPLPELSEFQGNLKSLSRDNYSKLKSRILELGFSEPISIWIQKRGKAPKKWILNGHQRLRTLQTMIQEGHSCPSKIPVSIVKAKSLKEAKKKVLALAGSYGRVEDEGLYEFLIDSEISPDEFVAGYSLADLDVEKFTDSYFGEPEGDPDEGDDLPLISENVHSVKPGQVWMLGDHRLICGDALSSATVDKLMSGTKAKLVFTDPPYDFKDNGFSSILKSASEDAHVFVMHDDRGIVDYLRSSDLDFQRFYVCDFMFKIPLGEGPYLRHILVSQEKNGDPISHKILGDSYSTINKMEYRANIKEDNTGHKHQKPVKIIEDFINHWSDEGDIVLDIFLGSGSTVIACEKTGRACYGIEVDPVFCSVIIERWEKFTGRKAKLTKKTRKKASMRYQTKVISD